MSEKNNLRFNRSQIYCFTLWTLVFLQVSAQLLSFVTPTQDSSSANFVNVWIRLGLYPTENWFGFTAITVLVAAGSWFYKYITDQKPTLKKAAPLLKPVVANILLFLEVWKLDKWAAKWTYINENAVPIIIGTISTVAIISTAYMIMTNKQLNNDFNKDVLPSLNEERDENSKNEPRTYSQSEVEYMTKHPVAYRRRMKDLQKSRERNIKNEIRTQHQDFQKKQNEQILQIAYAQLETNRKINDEKQLERLEKARATDDEDEIKKILNEAQEKIALNEKTSNVEGYISLSLTIVLIISIVLFWILTDNEKKQRVLNNLSENTNILSNWLSSVEEPLRTLMLCVGTPVLVVIVIALIYLSVNTFIRVVSRLIISHKEDSKRIDRTIAMIKKFFFDTFDGIMRPIFLIPDFLELIEELLLETDLQEKIDEFEKGEKKDDS